MAKKESKFETVVIAAYWASESKNGNLVRTLQFGPRKDKDGNVKGENPFPLTINEGDSAFVNIFDDEFREEYNVHENLKGKVELILKGPEDGDKKSNGKGKGKGNPDF